MEDFYTKERNVQIVISLLKQHGINQVVVSPGTTNMTFVGSIQRDPYFTIWSSPDERSAAYLACGIAAETNEPVVISCTGATASRNYMPALTEAYYRKLPILAITSHRGNHAIGHLIDQQIDRRTIPNDIVVESVTIPLVKDSADAFYCEIEANKAILALKTNGGGPAHINMFTAYNPDFSEREIPQARKIERYTEHDILPEMPLSKHIGVFVGSHNTFTDKEVNAIETFCESNNAVVFCDHTSGYYGKYKVNFALVCGQERWHTELCEIDLLIYIGEISGDNYKVWPTGETWRVSPDGAVRDRFGNLTKVFMMPEDVFFRQYGNSDKVITDYYDSCNQIYDNVFNQIPDMPFGNIWMAKQLSSKLPEGCTLHLGIYNSLRSWNFFRLPSSVTSYCNVGGFGIDGGISTLIGASLTNPNKLFFGVFGDLAFFYDMNVLGNHHVGNNIRLLIINNGIGTEFRNYGHPCSIFGEEADEFMAAARHYGNKSVSLVKHYATDLGFDYISANNKEEFLLNIEKFVATASHEKSIVFEVFTCTNDESEALQMTLNYMVDESTERKRKIRETIKNTLGEGIYSLLRKVIG